MIDIGVTAEAPFQRALEKELQTIFNWPNDRVKHEQTVQFGRETKRMDIALEGDGFGVIIEVKAPDVAFGSEETEQLISYMSAYHTSRDTIRCDYGLLVGREVWVYYRNDPNKKPERIVRFGFDAAHPDGIALGEALDYGEGSDGGKLRAYAKERMGRIDAGRKAEQLRNALTANDGAKVKEIVLQHLTAEGEDEDVVDKALEGVSIAAIAVRPVGIVPPPPPPPGGRGRITPEVHDKLLAIREQLIKRHYNMRDPRPERKFRCFTAIGSQNNNKVGFKVAFKDGEGAVRLAWGDSDRACQDWVTRCQRVRRNHSDYEIEEREDARRRWFFITVRQATLSDPAGKIADSLCKIIEATRGDMGY